MEIRENMVVSLRYSMKNSEGEEIENTLAGPAVQYIHGLGKIMPQLESQLEGLKAGDKKSFALRLPDSFQFKVAIDNIRVATSEEIMAGLPIALNGCGPGCSC